MNPKLTLALFSLVFLSPILAYADDDDAEEAVESLGWVAIGAGIIANLPFVIISKYRRYAVSAGGQSLQMARKIGTVFKPILNFHIMVNAIGYTAGMTHGLLLSSHLDSISLSLAITMTVLMASGVMLKYTSSRNAKIFNRLLHGQFGLLILLIILIALHVSTADD